MIVRPIVTRHNGREIKTMSPDPKDEYFADGLAVLRLDRQDRACELIGVSVCRSAPRTGVAE